MMKSLSIPLAALILMQQATSAASPQSNPQRKFEHSLFVQAGFKPIAEANADGREVRRVLLQDPYMMLPVPGIEIERLQGDRSTLRLQYTGWSSGPMQLPTGAWKNLERHEKAAFAPPAAFGTKSHVSPSAPPPICHGWIVRLEADYHRTVSWAACGGSKDPKEDYAIRIVRLAMATQPECPFDEKNIFWSFNACFKPKDNLDDPKLETRFAQIRKDFADQPGADRLMEARTALNAPGISLGNKTWMDAREAVLRFAHIEEARQKDIEQLQQINNDAVNGGASPADRARIARTLQGWRDFVRSQELNYSELLQRLAWPRPS